ncbi:hypothetical protein J6590_036020 [Homalodisca vitripennis]|nr:hypothetical protein J6590_036020 [Homalodisca vitripennis]
MTGEVLGKDVGQKSHGGGDHDRPWLVTVTVSGVTVTDAALLRLSFLTCFPRILTKLHRILGMISYERNPSNALIHHNWDCHQAFEKTRVTASSPTPTRDLPQRPSARVPTQ